MKRIICVALAVIMLCSVLPVFAAEVKWPYISDNAMPFKPFDKYFSMNNPPSFAWPMVEGATYDLRISKDKEFASIDFEKNGISYNVYNFNISFEEEVRYYWQVRFNLNGNTSVWSDPREFIIDEGANDNRMPEVNKAFFDANMKKHHPRLILDENMMDKLSKVKKSSNIYIQPIWV